MPGLPGEEDDAVLGGGWRGVAHRPAKRSPCWSTDPPGEAGPAPSAPSVTSLVRDMHMRRQCIAMVQTVDQYMLCHRAVMEQLREHSEWNS